MKLPSGCSTTMMSTAPDMWGVMLLTALSTAVPPSTTPLCGVARAERPSVIQRGDRAARRQGTHRGLLPAQGLRKAARVGAERAAHKGMPMVAPRPLPTLSALAARAVFDDMASHSRALPVPEKRRLEHLGRGHKRQGCCRAGQAPRPAPAAAACPGWPAISTAAARRKLWSGIDRVPARCRGEVRVLVWLALLRSWGVRARPALPWLVYAA